MSPPEKAKLQPLTPPLSDRLEQQYLPPSNTASPYQHNIFDLDNVPQMPAYSQTAFSSPEYHPVRIDQYRHEPYANPYHGHESYQAPFQGQPDSGLGFQYVGTLPADAPELLFSNAQGRTSLALQCIIRLRILRIIILFHNNLSVIASLSLLRD